MSERASPVHRQPSAETHAHAIAPHIHRAALEWQVTLWSGDVTPAEQLAFERWHTAHPDHAHAWQQVQRMGQQLHHAPDPLASRVLRATQHADISITRRKLLRGLGLVAVTGVLAYSVRETSVWQTTTADYRTARGERREITLPDGSRLTLNTASAIDLRFTASERRVLLRSGEILISTAADAAPHDSPAYRPFIVETAEGHVRALGTRFSVRALDAQSQVQVFDGAVAIAPVFASAPVRLEAGQQARFSRQRVETARPADPAAVAWSKGLLVAERLRLADFLTELARHRSGVLRCDPQVADLIVSGVYPLNDTDRILAALAQALPIRISRTTRYWVTVSAL